MTDCRRRAKKKRKLPLLLCTNYFSNLNVFACLCCSQKNVLPTELTSRTLHKCLQLPQACAFTCLVSSLALLKLLFQFKRCRLFMLLTLGATVLPPPPVQSPNIRALQQQQATFSRHNLLLSRVRVPFPPLFTACVFQKGRPRGSTASHKNKL